MITRHEPSSRMSKAVVAGGFIFLAGLTARNRDGGVAAQTADVLDQIDWHLANAGASKAQIVTATIWLKDMAGFAEMNGVWDRWVAPNAAPARATVQAQMAADNVLVEIMVQALAGTNDARA